MNEIAPPGKANGTTQGANGLPRYKWSLAQFERMIEHGILTEADRVELIGGELIPIAPKGNRQELVRDEFQDWLIGRLPADVKLSSELGWRPDGETYLEPDILIYPRGHRVPQIPAASVLLLIEIAKPSLEFDKGAKADVYASLGVREYWVVNAETLETTVHLQPTAEGYGRVSTAPSSEILTPHLVTVLSLSLGGLGIA